MVSGAMALSGKRYYRCLSGLTNSQTGGADAEGVSPFPVQTFPYTGLFPLCLVFLLSFVVGLLSSLAGLEG